MVECTRDTSRGPRGEHNGMRDGLQSAETTCWPAGRAGDRHQGGTEEAERMCEAQGRESQEADKERISGLQAELVTVIKVDPKKQKDREKEKEKEKEKEEAEQEKEKEEAKSAAEGKAAQDEKNSKPAKPLTPKQQRAEAFKAFASPEASHPEVMPAQIRLLRLKAL